MTGIPLKRENALKIAKFLKTIGIYVEADWYSVPGKVILVRR